ncbi:AI-2E family transporter [Chloroflexota bacterium]
MSTVRQICVRHWRLIAFMIGLVLVSWLLYALRGAIIPFVIGLILVYLLLPVISWVERKLPRQGRWQQTKRVSLIIVSFVVVLGVVGLVSYFVVTMVIDAFLVLVNNAPEYISQSLSVIQEWAEALRTQFPPEMWQQIDEFVLEAGTMLGNFIQDSFARGISFIPSTFSVVFGFAALPIFLFYVLKDSAKLNKGFYAALSPWVAEHTRNIASIIDRVLGRYIRAQIVLGLVVGYLVFIGLIILGLTPVAPALAVLAGVTEFIPVLGPWIGGIVAVIITLAIAPGKVIWVAILFLAVQLFENSILVPRIQGGYLRIHPAILVVLLVVGTYVAGFWGILLIAPLTATGVEIYRYVRRSVQETESGLLPHP